MNSQGTTRRARATAVALAPIALGASLAACDGMPESGSPATTEADEAAIHALLDIVERTFQDGDLDTAMTVFDDDVVIISQGEPDLAGTSAIRAGYEAMLSQFDVDAELTTEEIEIAGDLAYERGTYTLKLTEKASGQVVLDTVNRHIHIFKRQPDGAWKTWRMMVNSPEPVAGTP